MLSAGALFWVLLICVAAFEVLLFRSRTLRAWLQGSAPLNWLFTFVFLCADGTIVLLLAKSALDQQHGATVIFSVVIYVLGAITFGLALFSLARAIWEKLHQLKRSMPS